MYIEPSEPICAAVEMTLKVKTVPVHEEPSVVVVVVVRSSLSFAVQREHWLSLSLSLWRARSVHRETCTLYARDDNAAVRIGSGGGGGDGQV